MTWEDPVSIQWECFLTINKSISGLLGVIMFPGAALDVIYRRNE